MLSIELSLSICQQRLTQTCSDDVKNASFGHLDCELALQGKASEYRVLKDTIVRASIVHSSCYEPSGSGADFALGSIVKVHRGRDACQ